MDRWLLLGNLGEWIRFADAKAGSILALSAAAAAFVGSEGLSVRSALIEREFDWAALVLYALFVSFFAACGASMAFALRTVSPRIRTGYSPSLLHFEDIAGEFESDPSAYHRRLKEVSDEDANLQLELQIVELSRVARAKYHEVASAVTAVSWMVGFLILIVIWLIAVGG